MADRRKSTNVTLVNTSGVNSGNYGDWMLGGFTSYTPSEYTDKRDATNEKIENFNYKDDYLGGLNRGIPRLAQGVQRTSKWDTPTSQLAQQIQNIRPFQFQYQDQEDQALKTALKLNGKYGDPYQKYLNSTLKNILNPEEFQFSKQADYDKIYDRIMNGQYNPEEDASYLAYKNAYTRGGQQAMHDSMAQAAALTGGFGSSYGQSVGQQNYQNYMAGLADKIPELAQAAQDMYMNKLGVLNDLRDYETNMYQFGRNDLYNQYNTLGTQSDRRYGRYQDLINNNLNLAGTLSGIKSTDANIYNQDVNNTFDKFDAINGLRKTDYDLAQQDYDNYANTWGLVKGLSDSMYGRGLDELDNLYKLSTLYGNLDTENYNRFLDEGDRFQNAAQWQWGIEHPSVSGGSGGSGGSGRSSGGSDSANDYSINEELRYANSKGADPYDMWAYTQDQVTSADDLIKQTGLDPASMIEQIKRAASRRK